MITVDTLASMAIVLAEPKADGCIDACRLLLFVGDDFCGDRYRGRSLIVPLFLAFQGRG
jgi:hypothetical protein